MTEESLASTAVLKLGQRLVQELQLEPGCDTLSKWMAQYIAELMNDSQRLTGQDLDKKQSECFECVLALWQHMTEAGTGRRQSIFKPYDDIVRILSTLGEHTSPMYFSKADCSDNAMAEYIHNIDTASKNIIIFLLAAAVENIKPSQEEWLRLARDLPTPSQRGHPVVVLKLDRMITELSGGRSHEDAHINILKKAKDGVAHIRDVLDKIEAEIESCSNDE